MKKANEALREQIKDAGLSYWKVAEQTGVHPTTLTVWLRTPLTEGKQERINTAIQELTKKKA